MKVVVVMTHVAGGLTNHLSEFKGHVFPVPVEIMSADLNM